MSEISATEAARNFSDLLDGVEHRNERFAIVRRGKVVAHLAPVPHGRGSDVKALLRRHRPDPYWSGELVSVRELLEVEERS